MNNEIKKLIAAAITSGSIVAGSFYASDKLNCEYTISYKSDSGEIQEVCIDQEVKDAIGANLAPNKGFGGTTFNGK